MAWLCGDQGWESKNAPSSMQALRYGSFSYTSRGGGVSGLGMAEISSSRRRARMAGLSRI